MASDGNGTTICAVDQAPQVPPLYSEPGYINASCSVPICNNNTAILETCCRKLSSEWTLFDTAFGPYASCALDTNTSDPNPFQGYQNCLIRGGAVLIHCNTNSTTDYNFEPIVDTCTPGKTTLIPANVAGEGQVACSTEVNVNTSKAMAKCCGQVGSERMAFAYGCHQYCVGNTTLSECLTNELGEGDLFGCAGTPRSSNDVDALYAGSAFGLSLFLAAVVVVACSI